MESAAAMAPAAPVVVAGAEVVAAVRGWGREEGQGAVQPAASLR